jgi:2-iminoacetate synthase ThiH
MNDLSRILDMWKRYLEERGRDDYLTLYVHIPFCTSRCNFCQYKSDVLENPSQIDEQLEKLEQDMMQFSPVFKGYGIDALHIGGGTPSLMSVGQMKRLFDSIQSNFKLDVNDDNMFSIELHPASTDEEKIDFIYDSFINRASMGVQSFDEEILREENRACLSPGRTQDLIRYLMEKFNGKGGRGSLPSMRRGETEQVRRRRNLRDIAAISSRALRKWTGGINWLLILKDLRRTVIL